MDIVEHICNDQAKRNQTGYCKCKQNMRQPTKEEAMPKFPVDSKVFLTYKSFDDKDRAEIVAVSFPYLKNLFEDISGYIDSLVRRYGKIYPMEAELVDHYDPISFDGRDHNDFMIIHIGTDVKVVISIDVVPSVQNLTGTDGHLRSIDLRKWNPTGYNAFGKKVLEYFNSKSTFRLTDSLKDYNQKVLGIKDNSEEQQDTGRTDKCKAIQEIGFSLVKAAKELEKLVSTENKGS